MFSSRIGFGELLSEKFLAKKKSRKADFEQDCKTHFFLLLYLTFHYSHSRANIFYGLNYFVSRGIGEIGFYRPEFTLNIIGEAIGDHVRSKREWTRRLYAISVMQLTVIDQDFRDIGGMLMIVKTTRLHWWNSCWQTVPAKDKSDPRWLKISESPLKNS